MTFPYYQTTNPAIVIKLDRETFTHLENNKARITVTIPTGSNTSETFGLYLPTSKQTHSLIGYLFESITNVRTRRINRLEHNHVFDFQISNFKHAKFNSTWYQSAPTLAPTPTPTPTFLSNEHNKKMRKAFASLSSEHQFDINELVELVEELSKEIKERSNLILNIIDTRIIDNNSNKSYAIQNSTKKVADLQSLLNEEVLKLKRLQS